MLPHTKATPDMLIFMSTWQKLDSSERRKPQLRKCLQRAGCRQAYIALYQLVVKMGGFSPLWVGTPWSWRSWILSRLGNPQEQASKLYPFMATATAGVSRFLPCLSSSHNNGEQWCGSVSVFLLKLLLASCFITATVTQTKIPADDEHLKQLRMTISLVTAGCRNQVIVPEKPITESFFKCTSCFVY